MNNKVLNSNAIKMIAIIAMTIDHVAWAAYPGYPHEIIPVFLHIVGRLTCPIMCYCIAEGYHYTSNLKKYITRMFVFAIIAHFAYVYASNDFVDWKSFIPFYYGSGLNQTSVMWSLAWGLVLLRIADSDKIKHQAVKILCTIGVCIITFPADWSCIAALCILAIGSNRGKFRSQMFWMVFYVFVYSVVYFFAIDKVYGIVQMGVIFSIPIIMMYNGERGKNPRFNKCMKWLFYIYYPLHLFIIGLF